MQLRLKCCSEQAVFLIIRQVSGVVRQSFATGHCTCAGIYCQPVASFVLRMTCVAFQPMECHVMLFVYVQKPFPEVRILDFCEILMLPFLKPALIDRIDDIRGVTPDFNVRILPFDGLQPYDYSQQFHSVVGSLRKSSAHLFLQIPAFQHDAITSGTGISAGSAVSV